MSVDDLSGTTSADSRPAIPLVAIPPVAIPPVAIPPVAPATSGPSRQERFADGPRHVLAIVFATAWIICPSIEPVPDGPEPDYSGWLMAVDLLALAAIVAAVVLLWRGSLWARAAGVAAGLMMLVETALCPGLGHHVMGSFLWVQTGLSLFVLLTSLALPTLGLPPRPARQR